MKYIIDTKKMYSTQYKTKDVKLKDFQSVEAVIDVMNVLFKDEIIFALDTEHMDLLKGKTKDELGL